MALATKAIAVLLWLSILAQAWQPSIPQQPFGTTRARKWFFPASVAPDDAPVSLDDRSVVAKATKACGFSASELTFVENVLQDCCQAMGLQCNFDGIQIIDSHDDALPAGTTGRVVVLEFPGQMDTNALCHLNDMIAASVDDDLYSQSPQLHDPFILRFEHQDDDDTTISSILEQVIAEGELRIPLVSSSNQADTTTISFTPTEVVQVDGAFIQEPGKQRLTWDTSSIHVFDGLVDVELRKRLAQVVGGGKDLAGDQHPNTTRWIQSGLSDRLDGSENDNDDLNGPCTTTYELTHEAIQELCSQEHEAIQEMESRIARLFPDFIVSRIPEAVFGEAVSPLTANALVHGDTLEYQIDGDPYTTPPSLWTDVFGRYPNRSTGKPRFVSFLIYLNDEWPDEWGAPTRFLDVASDTEFAVIPRPGRCVVMDQDVSHAVSAPNQVAGKRAHYSMVWKLVLHPIKPGQDMCDLSCGRPWPAPTLIGSANQCQGELR